MLLTRNKIDRLTALWNAEAIDLKTALEENNFLLVTVLSIYPDSSFFLSTSIGSENIPYLN